MNRNDPERSRCSAPEEEYDTPITPESAADARIRKHLRVWVRRLESNENFEARQPANVTRGKKKLSAIREPYEWVRCCNPSCGKWRVLLRFMDAKQQIVDRVRNKEWYCVSCACRIVVLLSMLHTHVFFSNILKVMNKWDEKIASCAAPQESLPALGCPPWAMPQE